MQNKQPWTPAHAGTTGRRLPAAGTPAESYPDLHVEREADLLERIWQKREVEVHFQPVVRLRSGDIMGYEALVRPPLAGPLATAAELFAAASRHGVQTALELACCEQAVKRFVKLSLRGKLLLTMSPDSIIEAHFDTGSGLDFLRRSGMRAGSIVMQVGEQNKAPNLERLCEAVMVFRSLGADVAIDHLGRGLSSLWLWSELRPELVKLDAHLVQGVHRNAIRSQFLRAILEIADGCGARLVAEGIDDRSDYALLRDMGVSYGQGSFIARASPSPAAALKGEVLETIRSRAFAALPEPLPAAAPLRNITGERLLIEAPALGPDTPNERVFEAFDAAPGLHALAVVAHGRPVGIIKRNDFMSQYGRPGNRETYGTQPCTLFMDAKPLLVETRLSVQEISERLVRAELRHLEGFVFTDRGRYAGLGAGHDVIREISVMQLEAARYANPLTLLPGNVPIDDAIRRLLASNGAFVVAYCDLNHFKPFNDAYGYRRGDEMIRLTARTLSEACDRQRDFLGHIGGDDFIVLFRSADWKSRCERVLDSFARQAQFLFDEEDRAQGALKGEDRAGNPVRFPLASLAIGALPVQPGQYRSHLEVAEAASEAKKQAKRIGGNAMFVERRRLAAHAKEDGAQPAGDASSE